MGYGGWEIVVTWGVVPLAVLFRMHVYFEF